jgi:hypothetical protein
MIRFGLFFVLFMGATSMVEPSKKQVPAHFVRVSFYRYLQQTETTFKEWRTFMNDMSEKNGEREDRYMPDFQQIALDWKTRRNLQEMFEKGQLDSLPVVGIRYEDVLRYISYKNEGERTAQKSETQFKRWRYLLPTVETDTLLGLKGNLLAGTKCQKWEVNTFPILPANHPTGKSKSGLFFYHQNASEMSQTKGLALRGSYKNSLKESGLSTTQDYFVPSGFIGFRLMIDVLEE